MHGGREPPVPLTPSLTHVYSSFATFILDCPSLPPQHSDSMREVDCRGSFIFQTPYRTEFNSPSMATKQQQQTWQQQSTSLKNKERSFRKLLGVCSADSSRSGPVWLRTACCRGFPCCYLQAGVRVTSMAEITDFLPKKGIRDHQLLFINCKSGTPVPQLAVATVLPVFGRICATSHRHGRILTAATDTVLSLGAALRLQHCRRGAAGGSLSSEADTGTCPFCWAGTGSILLALLLCPRGESLL